MKDFLKTIICALIAGIGATGVIRFVDYISPRPFHLVICVERANQDLDCTDWDKLRKMQ